MNKGWDIDVPSVAIFKECLRVLKEGSFAFFMSAPRQDVSAKMICNLKEAGFDIAFDPIEWVYASGFPKAQNIAKAIDKRLFTQWIKLRWQYTILEFMENQEDTPKEELKQYWHDCKRLWAKKQYNIDMKTRNYIHPDRQDRSYQTNSNIFSGNRKNDQIKRPHGFGAIQNTLKEQGARKYEKGLSQDDAWQEGLEIDEIISPEAKAVDGMYSCSPKPSRELILVVQKPFSQPTNIDLAIETQRGGLYYDRCRHPAEYQDALKNNKQKENQQKILKKVFGGRLQNPITFGQVEQTGYKIRMPYHRGGPIQYDGSNENKNQGWNDPNSDYCGANSFTEIDLRGRFPANLLVSDNVLDEFNQDSFSDKFSLDKWWWAEVDKLPKDKQNTFPFLYVPKPSKAEKNKGLESFIEKETQGLREIRSQSFDEPKVLAKNIHPTCKAIALMTYLIALSPTKEGDTILDPFLGSGTTMLSCILTNRQGIGIEMMLEYLEIANARIEDLWQEKMKKPFTMLTQLTKSPNSLKTVN